jgi:hypothetical protein
VRRGFSTLWGAGPSHRPYHLGAVICQRGMAVVGPHDQYTADHDELFAAKELPLT